jgi:hypothetical protein
VDATDSETQPKGSASEIRIDAAMIFAQTDFVKVDAHKQV